MDNVSKGWIETLWDGAGTLAEGTLDLAAGTWNNGGTVAGAVATVAKVAWNAGTDVSKEKYLNVGLHELIDEEDTETVRRRVMDELAHAKVSSIEYESAASLLADLVSENVTQLVSEDTKLDDASRKRFEVIMLVILNNLRKNVIESRFGTQAAPALLATIDGILSQAQGQVMDSQRWAELGAELEAQLVGKNFRDLPQMQEQARVLMRALLIPGGHEKVLEEENVINRQLVGLINSNIDPKESVLAKVLSGVAKSAINEDIFISLLEPILQPYAKQSLDQLLFGDKSSGAVACRQAFESDLKARSKGLNGKDRKNYVTHAMRHADQWLESADGKAVVARWNEEGQLASDDKSIIELKLSEFSSRSRLELFVEGQVGSKKPAGKAAMQLLSPWLDSEEARGLAVRLGQKTSSGEDTAMLALRVKEARAMAALEPLVKSVAERKVSDLVQAPAPGELARIKLAVMDRLHSWIGSARGRDFAMQVQDQGRLELDQVSELEALVKRSVARDSLVERVKSMLSNSVTQMKNQDPSLEDAQRAQLVCEHALPRVEEWLKTQAGETLVEAWNDAADKAGVNYEALRTEVIKQLRIARAESAFQARLEDFLKKAFDRFLPDEVAGMDAQQVQNSARGHILVKLAARLNKDVDQILADFRSGALSEVLAHRLAPSLVDGMREQVPALFGADSFDELTGKQIGAYVIKSLGTTLDPNFEARVTARKLVEQLFTVYQQMEEKEDRVAYGLAGDAIRAVQKLINEGLKPNSEIPKELFEALEDPINKLETRAGLAKSVLSERLQKLGNIIEETRLPEKRVLRTDVLGNARSKMDSLISEIQFLPIDDTIRRHLITHLERVKDEDFSETRVEEGGEERRPTELRRLDQAIRVMGYDAERDGTQAIVEELKQLRASLLPILAQDERRESLESNLQDILGKFGPVTAAKTEEQLVKNLVGGILQFVGWWIGNAITTFFLAIAEGLGVNVDEQRKKLSERHFHFKVQDTDVRIKGLAKNLIETPTDVLEEERIHNMLHLLIVGKA